MAASSPHSENAARGPFARWLGASAAREGFVLLGLLGIVAGATVLATRTADLPFEDAAMLLRYAQHVAAGYGFTWNVGEPPVDGATDFLTTLLLSGLIRSGVAPEAGARGLAIAAHLGTVGVVFVGLRRVLGVRLPLAALAAFHTGISAALGYIAVFFTTSVFAFFASIVAVLGLRSMRAPLTAEDLGAYGVACLLLGLTRPEGVILAALITLAIAAASEPRSAQRLLWAYAQCVLGLGSVYLLWRWSYFGHLLPNPFYRKGGGLLHFDGLQSALKNAVLHGLGFVAVLAALVCVHRSRLVLATLLLGLSFIALWVLLSDEMNYLGRFQFALLPVLAVFVTYSLDEAWPELAVRRPGWALGSLASLLGAVSALSVYRSFVHHPSFRDGRHDVALRLRRFRSPSALLATTEAGLLPYFSEWPTLDAWGLNDAWIAQHHGVTSSYLEEKHPTLIMVHGPPGFGRSGGAPGSWGNMLDVLIGYAQLHHFVRAATFIEAPGSAHHYLVDPNSQDADAIVRAIRAVSYTSPSSGERLEALYDSPQTAR